MQSDAATPRPRKCWLACYAQEKLAWEREHQLGKEAGVQLKDLLVSLGQDCPKAYDVVKGCGPQGALQHVPVPDQGAQRAIAAAQGLAKADLDVQQAAGRGPCTRTAITSASMGLKLTKPCRRPYRPYKCKAAVFC